MQLFTVLKNAPDYDKEYENLGINAKALKEAFEGSEENSLELEFLLKAFECDSLSGQTDQKRGELAKLFGTNTLPSKKARPLWKFIIEAAKDKILILLIIAAVLSISIGIYENVWMNGDKGWIEGLAIAVAVLVVVLVNSVNDYQKEKQFTFLNEKSSDFTVKVFISGQLNQMKSTQVLVGDLIRFETGDLIPADGILVRATNLLCDESTQTGESEAIEKNEKDLVISGSKVLAGTADVLVLAIGPYSVNGRLLSNIQESPEMTPMQFKLGILANQIAKFGAISALLMLVSLLIKFFVIASHEPTWPLQGSVIVQHVLHIFIQAVTIIVVAVPEGLPMAVTLALAFATTQMLKDNNLVRVLSSCETMGCATTICSDKTGTLTQNKMTVTAGRLFDRTIDYKQPPSKLSILERSLVFNSTVFQDKAGDFIGAKTECALLDMCRKFNPGINIEKVKESGKFVRTFPFSSSKKCSSVIVEEICPIKDKPTLRVYLKGAAEIVSSRCVYIETAKDKVSIDETREREIKQFINELADQTLRTICLAYQDISSDVTNLNEFEEEPLEKYTLLGILGIEDPLRPNSAESVKQCQEAGIFVRMVTGDNLATARAIATKCGILMSGGVIMEGIRFRGMSDAELLKILPKLQVLARSTPADKIKLVKKLQEMGNIVAVTGDGTNDGPALRAADVGFAMGITGTEVAKDAADIVLLDDNFGTIVKAVSWGRCVREGVRKFLQFQLTVNVSAVITAFVTAISGGENSSILSAIQLLWINLIMDSFAALALATDPPGNELLNVPPDHPDDGLVTYEMIRMIIFQSILQTSIMLGLYFAGFLNENPLIQRSFLFNTFVFLQLFNEINCRIVDDRTLNVFQGIFKNKFFLIIWTVTVISQMLIIQFGGKVFGTVHLGISQWCLSIGLGASSLAMGLFVRILPKIFKSKRTPKLHPTRGQLRWQQTLTTVRQNLTFYNALRRPPMKYNSQI